MTDACRLFERDRFNLRMIMYLSIFVTFGVIFPPLAVMICVTVIIQTYCTQLYIGQYVVSENGDSESQRSNVLQTLSESSRLVGVLFKRAVYVVGPCAAFFYSFTVYDTYADAGGGSGAVWMSVSMFVLGCLISGLFNVLVDRELKREEEEKESLFRSSKVEMRLSTTGNPLSTENLHSF